MLVRTRQRQHSCAGLALFETKLGGLMMKEHSFDGNELTKHSFDDNELTEHSFDDKMNNTRPKMATTVVRKKYGK
jgi:hypothetical protein